MLEVALTALKRFIHVEDEEVEDEVAARTRWPQGLFWLNLKWKNEISLRRSLFSL